ncbi:uncharacterized protein Bfra_010081 [Botrytis fragariae]|uniref:Uncharacterized protein n=1 Tax=Botrytis fragariae TaxID=1964551 RepID=A0A8H6ALS0_9HELO|nr:uncharacterized protein Bfra_010081 [Botrytis fragariae]KAF5869936.1 hypothetical protein Bfra_010081 [Botrytis fragariae]
MPGSGDSPPINHQGLPQGLGITSNQTSGRATPRDSLGGQNTGSRVNNPRIRSSPQMQQQDGANNPNFRPGNTLMQQQMGINMLHQHRIEQQQAQNLQRQYHQTEQYRAQQQLQQQQYAAQQQMQRNQAQQQRMQQQHVGQLQTFQPVHMLPGDIPNPSPTAMRLNGGQMEPAFQQLFSMPPTQLSMKNGRPNTFAPAAPTSEQPRVSTQQPEQEEAEEEETGYESTCLSLSINSPLTITGDDNIITFHPAPQVQKITDAILKSLHSASEGSRGIPMGDADGIPRGIKVEVSAAVTINGKHNILGEEAVKIWGQKVKGDALTAQTQAQRMLAQAHIQSQATAQAQGQGQGQGQGPKNGTASMESTVQRNAQTVDSIIQAREQALVTQRQIQNELAAQEQEFPSPQEPFQTNGDGNGSVRGQAHPHWSMPLQASIQQQPKAQEGRTKPQMGIFPAGPSKDFGKRARESSVSQHDEEVNKKTKMDM